MIIFFVIVFSAVAPQTAKRRTHVNCCPGRSGEGWSRSGAATGSTRPCRSSGASCPPPSRSRAPPSSRRPKSSRWPWTTSRCSTPKVSSNTSFKLFIPSTLTVTCPIKSSFGTWSTTPEIEFPQPDVYVWCPISSRWPDFNRFTLKKINFIKLPSFFFWFCKF